MDGLFLFLCPAQNLKKWSTINATKETTKTATIITKATHLYVLSLVSLATFSDTIPEPHQCTFQLFQALSCDRKLHFKNSFSFLQSVLSSFHSLVSLYDEGDCTKTALDLGMQHCHLEVPLFTAHLCFRFAGVV